MSNCSWLAALALASLLGLAACSARAHPERCDPAVPCPEAGTVCDAEAGLCVPDPSRACHDGNPLACPGGRPFGGDVGCTAGAGCGGLTPVCEEDTGACRACTTDAECAIACDEDVGRCVEASEAIFLAPDAARWERACTEDAPCADLAAAVDAATDARAWVILAPGGYSSAALTWTRRGVLHVVAHGADVRVLASPVAVAVHAGGVAIEGGSFHASLQCDGRTSLTRPWLSLRDVDVDLAGSGDGIDVGACDVVAEAVTVRGAEVGLRAHDAGALEVGQVLLLEVGAGAIVQGGVLTGKRLIVERAVNGGIHLDDGLVDLVAAHVADCGGVGVVSGSPLDPAGAPTLRLHASEIVGNRAGGVRLVKGDFSITSTVIAENGDGVTPTGGLTIVGARGTFGFNTVVGNRGLSTNRIDSSSGRPVRYQTIAAPVRCEVPLELVGSLIEAAHMGAEERAHGCGVSSSAWLDAPGTEGLRCLPAFVDANPDTPVRDYHLGATSTCVDLASSPTVETDVDGEARPRGAAPDLGADEAR